MPNLLLINPSTTHKGLGNTRATSWPPLNLPYLAAVTPPRYRIEVIDENVQPFRYADADIVGITAYTATAYRAYQIAQMYQRQGIPTVMGGIHASMIPEEAARYCDAVVIGEAETIWPRVLEDFEGNRLQKIYEASWPNLETLPIPRRDILQNRFYLWGSIQTSRGCPMNCTFCSVTAFNGRRFRRRALDSVIEELEQIPQKRVLLTDDNIIGFSKKDLEWVFGFFTRILERGIKKVLFAQASILFGEDPELIRLASKAGLKIVFIGVESLNADTLEDYHKGINLDRLNQNRYKELVTKIRENGISVLASFVLGDDRDEKSVFQSTLEFVESSRIDVLQVSKLTPLPGTELWKTMQRDNRILCQNFPEAWEDYRFTKMVFVPKRLTIEEVYEGFTYLRSAYYGFWKTLKRTFCTLLATRSLTATILAYGFNASYRKAFRKSEHYKLYGRKNLKKKYRSPPR